MNRNFVLLFSVFSAFGAMAHGASGDPEKGYSTLVNGGYIGCGIPVSVMKRALVAKGVVPDPVITAFVPMAGIDVFNSPVTIPGRTGENEKLTPSMTIFETKRGVKAINFNCLSCHGEAIDGEFIVGLGNRTRDYTQNMKTFVNALPVFAWSNQDREELNAFRRGVDAVAPYTRPHTVGVNPAINLTYALFARRDPQTFEWTDQPSIEPPSTLFPPVDVPPWWRMGSKRSMFYNGEFNAHHRRIMTLASTLCVEDKEEWLALDEPFEDVEAYIKSLQAPLYPKPVNHELVAEGEKVFEQNCASCHGTYGKKVDYPETFVPIEVVGTDAWLMEQQTGFDGDRFRRWLEEASLLVFGEVFETSGRRGYIAPDLRGVWATAPFLHNGSIPTLEGVLDSSKRPRYWWKDGTKDSQDYDVARIGVKHRVSEHGYYQNLPFVRRYLYDTTLPGYGNLGHEFGDALTADERRGVIEYLKTL